MAGLLLLYIGKYRKRIVLTEEEKFNTEEKIFNKEEAVLTVAHAQGACHAQGQSALLLLSSNLVAVIDLLMLTMKRRAYDYDCQQTTPGHLLWH